jgi:hypothetical protein
MPTSSILYNLQQHTNDLGYFVKSLVTVRRRRRRRMRRKRRRRRRRRQ